MANIKIEITLKNFEVVECFGLQQNMITFSLQSTEK